MIYSMTGYANRNLHLGDVLLQIDIRSVNHRFLDLTLKCPEEFKCLEQELREIIAQRISRGKLDLRINVQEIQTSNFNINQKLLFRYAELSKQILQQIPEVGCGTTTEIISIPGMLIKNSLDIETLKPNLLKETDLLILDLLNSQMAEGEKLQQILTLKAQQMNGILHQSREILPTVTDSYKNKLRQKLLDALGDPTLNEQRFQQEFVYFCQKIDVDEELSRLEAHLKQFNHLLNGGGSVGKKIDFLIQEMHREANTFGAKSISITTTNYSLELKVLIEQMKEQIQNIA